MTFGIRAHGGTHIKRHGKLIAGIAFWAATTALCVLLLSGCSGGSSSGGSSSGSSGGTTQTGGTGNQANGATATLTGTVLNVYNNNSPLAGAIAAFGTYYAIADSTGAFSLRIPAGAAGSLSVYGAQHDASGNPILGAGNIPVVDTTTATGFSNTGLVGNMSVAIFSPGLPIPAQPAGTIDAVGTISLYSFNGPPPPPSI